LRFDASLSVDAQTGDLTDRDVGPGLQRRRRGMEHVVTAVEMAIARFP
jgi:hypothetical protein